MGQGTTIKTSSAESGIHFTFDLSSMCDSGKEIYPEVCLGTVMVNHTCQIGWATECPDFWSNVILNVSVTVFWMRLHEAISANSNSSKFWNTPKGSPTALSNDSTQHSKTQIGLFYQIRQDTIMGQGKLVCHPLPSPPQKRDAGMRDLKGFSTNPKSFCYLEETELYTSV